jgi:hypothetical protein
MLCTLVPNSGRMRAPITVKRGHARTDHAADELASRAQYVAAFRHVEAGARDKGATALKDLSTSVASRVTATDRAAITKLVDAQLAKLT